MAKNYTNIEIITSHQLEIPENITKVMLFFLVVQQMNSTDNSFFSPQSYEFFHTFFKKKMYIGIQDT